MNIPPDDGFRAPVEDLRGLVAGLVEVDGVELDFAAAPGADAFCLAPKEASQQASVPTNFVRDVAA